MCELIRIADKNYGFPDFALIDQSWFSGKGSPKSANVQIIYIVYICPKNYVNNRLGDVVCFVDMPSTSHSEPES